jgi:F-type H+-transporting ATPase subunit alpha
VNQIREFEDQFIETIDVKYPDELKAVATSGVLSPEFGEELLKTANNTIDQLLAGEEL